MQQHDIINIKRSKKAGIQTAQADLVCFSHLRWNDVFQRPHHLMTRWGQERRVFYIEEYHVDSGPRRLEVLQAAPGVRVVEPYLLSWNPEEHLFLAELYASLFADYAIEQYIFWYYSPMFLRFTQRFKPLYTVYDCMQELAAFKGALKQLPALEADLLEQADLVFSGGYSLKRVDALLHQSSWDSTWEQMKSLVQDGLGESMDNCEKVNGNQAGNPVQKSFQGNSARDKDPDGRHDRTIERTIKLIAGDTYLPQSERKAGNGHKQRPFDFLIVGAGFAGSVLAERLARGSGMNVLVIDQRNHIAGNAYDHYDEHGLLVHKYGPHIFHTNSKEVFAYLSRFTEWRPYEHRVRASIDGQLVPIPINLDTVNSLYGLSLTSFELQAWFDSVAEPVSQVKTSEDVVVSKVGQELYEKFFRNYTRKQWGLDPSELDASVTSRVPVRLNRDDRYFSDTYQSMPRHGYTKMFENILDHPNIKVMLNTGYREVVDLVPYRKVIFTGPVDEYFDHRFGRLPYRSLDFEFRTFDEQWRQPVAVINHPNEHAYTRVTEFKHLTGQEHNKTSLVYEYPCSEGEPYYPIPRPENTELYSKYKKLAEATPNVYFAGRLGTYRYYNMDQVTAQALNLYSRIMGLKKGEAAGSFVPAHFQIDVPCSLLVTQVVD